MRGRHWCVWVLIAGSWIGPAQAEDTLDPLFARVVRQMLDELDDPDPRLRASHAESFGTFPEAIHFLDSIVPALLRLTADPDPRVRQNAVDSLAEHADAVAPNAEVEAALRAATRDPQPGVRRSGVRALTRFERGHGEGYLTLWRAVADEDSGVREEAMRIASVLFEPNDLALAVEAGGRDVEPAVRRRAVLTAASTLEPAAAYPSLFAALGDPAAGVSNTAFEKLLEILPGVPREATIRAFQHPSPPVRSQVEKVFSRLAEAAWEPASTENESHPLEPLLIGISSDPSPDVRAWAATTLGEVGLESAAALQALRSVLQEPAPGPRLAAATALAEIRPADPATRSALVEAITDPTLAAQAIRALHSTEKDDPKLRDRLLALLPDLQPARARSVARLLVGESCSDLPLDDIRALVEEQNRAAEFGSPDFAVVVGADHPATEIPHKTLSRIFLGKTARWPADRPVSPVDLSRHSPVRESFSRRVHSRSARAIWIYFQRLDSLHVFDRPPPELCTQQAVLRFVSETPNAIGYVAEGTALGSAVRRLALTD